MIGVEFVIRFRLALEFEYRTRRVGDIRIIVRLTTTGIRRSGGMLCLMLTLIRSISSSIRIRIRTTSVRCINITIRS